MTVEMRLVCDRLAELLRQFAADRHAVSALEFALILPIMLTLYFGTVEVGTALTINRKVTHVTSSLADLVTQSKVISNTDMTNIFDAAESIIVPYNVNTLKITVSGITINAAGVAKVTWSDTRHGTALTVNSTVTDLPAGVKQASTFIVTAKVSYDFAPTIGYVLTGTFTLNDQFYLRPRASSTVCRVTC
ncbi:MAG: TadE/TadG family type IV pilus assembly protein [Bauldia sp.]